MVALPCFPHASFGQRIGNACMVLSCSGKEAVHLAS